MKCRDINTGRFPHTNCMNGKGVFMLQEMVTLICEDSAEGIFTAIYEAYERKLSIEHVKLHVGEVYEPALFTTYQKVLPNEEKAEKVIRTLQKKFPQEDYLSLCYALSSPDKRKADAVFHTIVWGLKGLYQNSILEHLSCDAVRITMELARNAQNEYLHLRGFTRFEELKGGLLYTVIAPRNHILPQLAAHFADRFPGENFIMLDEGRLLYAVHPAHKQWFLVTPDPVERTECSCSETVELSDRERYYQELFREFCHNISIEDRRNLKLQRNMLPLHFRLYMTEFHD